jgi:YggT family protein
MTLTSLINLLFTLFYFSLIARIILSFIIPMLGQRPTPVLTSIYSLTFQITEPVLAPLRRVLPKFGTFDFSPMVAIIVMGVIQSAIFGK